MTRLRRLVAAAVAAVSLFGTTVLLAPASSAHDVLLRTEPAQGSTVAQAPAQVRLVFDKPALALGTVIDVTGPDGRPVSAGKPRLVDATVTEDLAGTLRPGGYVVLWRVTSVDGHPVSGRFTFQATGTGVGAVSVQPGAGASAPNAGPATASSGSGPSAAVLWSTGGLVLAVLVVAVLMLRRRRATRPEDARP